MSYTFMPLVEIWPINASDTFDGRYLRGVHTLEESWRSTLPRSGESGLPRDWSLEVDNIAVVVNVLARGKAAFVVDEKPVATLDVPAALSLARPVRLRGPSGGGGPRSPLVEPNAFRIDVDCGASSSPPNSHAFDHVLGSLIGLCDGERSRESGTGMRYRLDATLRQLREMKAKAQGDTRPQILVAIWGRGEVVIV